MVIRVGPSGKALPVDQKKSPPLKAWNTVQVIISDIDSDPNAIHRAAFCSLLIQGMHRT